MKKPIEKIKRLRFPKGITMIRMKVSAPFHPFNALNEAAKQITTLRAHWGYSKKSRAKYVLTISETGFEDHAEVVTYKV